MPQPLRSVDRPSFWIGALSLAAPALFIASTPWLKDQPDGVVYLVAGAAATTTVIGAFLLAILKDKQLDEWHRSAARFSGHWGWLAGAGLVALLLALPPIHNGIVAFAASVSDGATPDKKAVLLVFMLGFVTVVFAQAACTMLLSVIWRFWMSRKAV